MRSAELKTGGGNRRACGRAAAAVGRCRPSSLRYHTTRQSRVARKYFAIICPVFAILCVILRKFLNHGWTRICLRLATARRVNTDWRPEADAGGGGCVRAGLARF